MVSKTYQPNIPVAPSRMCFDSYAMDADAISSGLAFLTSELEKLDPTLREPLTSTTYPRDIEIESGGGWVEATSAFFVEYAIIVFFMEQRVLFYLCNVILVF